MRKPNRRAAEEFLFSFTITMMVELLYDIERLHHRRNRERDE